MNRFKLYRRVENSVQYVGTFDAPEKAMGYADAYQDQTYPEWKYHGDEESQVWLRDEWVLVSVL